MEESKAREIMGKNFIGCKELSLIDKEFKLCIPEHLPPILISQQELEQEKDTHILLLAVEKFCSEQIITIESIKQIVQDTKSKLNPKFYNQDWYIKEKFISLPLKAKWIFISKSVLSESRGVQPIDIEKKYTLYKAVDLVYAFFVYFYLNEGKKLWENDYVWCSDRDDKGDQIYIGRYTDPSGFNEQGLEIHRHLSIKDNYGSV